MVDRIFELVNDLQHLKDNALERVFRNFEAVGMRASTKVIRRDLDGVDVLEDLDRIAKGSSTEVQEAP